MVVLEVIILFLCIFNTVSLFVIGSALVKHTDLLTSLVGRKKKKPQKFTDVPGFRMDPEENLVEVPNTAYPLEETDNA